MGSDADHQRERLEQLLELARISRGWSRHQLAEALGRDPSRLIPPSGNPKLDFVKALAEILEWPVGDVVDVLFAGQSAVKDIAGDQKLADFEEAYEAARQCAIAGDFTRYLHCVKQMHAHARPGEERATAFAAECNGWYARGRFQQALDAANAGLAEKGIPDWLSRNLLANLAYGLYHLWRLPLALGVCEVLLDRIGGDPSPDWDRTRKLDFLHTRYVRGNVLRRLATVELDRRDDHQIRAEHDLEVVVALCDQWNDESPENVLRARRHECQSALVEVKVSRGHMSPEEGCRKIYELLDIPEDHQGNEKWLYAVGWTAIHGCNISVHCSDRDLCQSFFAIFSEKAFQIADQIDNWALRERVLGMQFAIHEQGQQVGSQSHDLAIDDEDRALIVATMGRFPHFRGPAWRYLDQPRRMNE